ncbi:S1 RNA-binding domain-containing protein 1-like isoform X2 [Eupeodes corollae]|uniref:S1 RNA-binding domain-containing protein 1-like isoform X2 n=1 Tax=Eupeodes corollae TaxID=290404 RepID=UPI0024916102|nr:S1 RNA-binding domain-containing protein 1-like isoform X2 [Eupeodes corollae]
MGCCESLLSDPESEDEYVPERRISQRPIVQEHVIRRQIEQRPARPRSKSRSRENHQRRRGPPPQRQKPPSSIRDPAPAAINHDWSWTIHDRLAEVEHIDSMSARNIVKLFEDENTIPFICRYRQDMINRNITPNKLRAIKTSYTNIIELRKRAENIIRELDKVIEVDNDIRTQILGARTFKDLEYLNSVYKPSKLNPRSLGIDTHAYRLLLGQSPLVQLLEIVDNRNPYLDTTNKVEIGLTQVISDLLSKHRGILAELVELQKDHQIVLKCSQAVKSDNEAADEEKKERDRLKQSKYETYFKFENDIRCVRPHQILAINRGEKMKFLNVQVILPDSFKNAIRGYIYAQFMIGGIKYPLRNLIFDMAFENCYNEKLVTYVSKQVRADLTEMGKKDAIECFAKNLKQLLLKPPLKGERILGIDPGFKNGCKLALISETSDLLDTGVMYPHNNKPDDDDKWGIKLANLLAKHSCKTIALGDGTACRETELWLTNLFDKGILDRKNIWYDIVSEQGTSVYSCSDLAKKEFPNLDVKLISAVSIARRLIDPLSEYVKVEPRHLGIGMYQMDINEKLLSKSLNEVVSECVSFVGVDINTASLNVLKYIAGLDHKKAEQIVQYRQNIGPFLNRNDLLRVKTIEKATFVQCAGFIRIDPKSAGGKLQNMLDCTWVHPESYTVAIDIIQLCNLELRDIGNSGFISAIKSFVNSNKIDVLANHFEIPAERLRIVLNALQRELLQDYRPDFDRKVFIQEITKLDDLFVGQIVTGEVRNIVSYGAFVNIGLGIDALIHRTKMNKAKLNLGDRVSASVIDLDLDRQRISLRLDEVI